MGTLRIPRMYRENISSQEIIEILDTFNWSVGYFT